MTFWIAAMMAAAAAAPCPPGGDPAIAPTRPNWKTPLSAERIWWAYPPAAVAANKGGKAVILCAIGADGRTTDCQVISETPAGMGFGEAAVSLRHDMLFIPATRCGKPTPSEVTIPITFQIPEDEIAPQADRPPPSTEALALGKRLALALNIVEDVEQVMENEIQQRIMDDAAEPSPEERRAFYEAMQATRPMIGEIVIESAGSALAREMTLEDLKAAVAFFEGPTGQALRTQRGKLQSALEFDMKRVQDKLQAAFEQRYCEILKTCDVHKALKALD